MFALFDYDLDRSDPDLLILCRQDGSFVAAVSARGATEEGILEAAKEDRRKWLRPRAVDYIVRDRSGGKLMSSR